MTSPTTRLDFTWARSGRRPISLIPNRIRRCTGFRPSRASGQGARVDDASRRTRGRRRASPPRRRCRRSARRSPRRGVGVLLRLAMRVGLGSRRRSGSRRCHDGGRTILADRAGSPRHPCDTPNRPSVQRPRRAGAGAGAAARRPRRPAARLVAEGHHADQPAVLRDAERLAHRVVALGGTPKNSAPRPSSTAASSISSAAMPVSTSQ